MDELAIRANERELALAHTARDIVAPIFRQRRLASLIFLGIFFGGILTLLVLPRKYEAEMEILANRERVDAAVTPNPDSPAPAVQEAAISEEDLNSEVELLKSRDLLESVVLACGLESQSNSWLERFTERVSDAFYGAAPSAATRRARAVQELENHLTIDLMKKTALIRVGYTSHDPQAAARVLQSLATLYQEKHAAVHRPPGTFEFFEQEANRYGDELAAAETKLINFDNKEGVVAAQSQKQLVIQELSQLEAESSQVQVALFAVRKRTAALKALAASTPERQTTQIRKVGNAQLLAQLEGTLLSLRLRHSELITKYAPDYPLVQDVETQIAEAQRAVAEARQAPVEEITTDRSPAQDWITTELAKAESERAALDAQTGAVSHEKQLSEQRARELDQKGALQDDLVRKVKAVEENYLLYLHKREEARISDALDRKRIVNVSVAEAATVPALPTLHLGWLLIGSLFTAGIASMGTAFAVDRIDTSFRTPAELVRYLDLDVLASIPRNALRQ
jgi:uncharacterized protein involved in exopolysaccharide biosynthesis